MALSIELQGALNEARRSLSQDPEGALILPVRRSIWKAMGAYEFDEGNFAEGVGYLRRTDLAAMATRYVMSYWEDAFPNNNTPTRILEAVDEYLRGNIYSDEVWDGPDIDSFIAMLEEQEDPAVAVGYAAVHVAVVAMNDEILIDEDEEEELPMDLLDEELDYTDWSSEYFAAMIYAGGPPGDPDSSNQRRREFWTWYLNTAVPETYEYYDDADYE
jgi:hypothetical protein